jgi:DNA polymerase-1
MKTLLLIDGNAIMHRAYFALPAFQTRDGIPTNMIYGFFAMLHKAIAELNVDHVLIAFDTPKPNFRQKLLPQYQAQRPKADSEFVTQIPYLRELLDKSGIIRLEKDGYEADDVIGTVADHYKNNSIRVFILTGDKDILQLVDENVFVVAPKTGISKIDVYNEEGVRDRLGVTPAQIPDFKALIGDPSDNYPGAHGIGPKTAIKLIDQFGTVENLIKNIDKIDSEKIRSTVKKYKKDIELSKKLATIVCDVDIDIPLEKTRFEGFNPQMKPLMEKLQLYSLLKRLFGEKKQPVSAKAPTGKKEDPNQIELF